MAEQVQGRRPAAAHQHGVAGDAAGGAGLAVAQRVDAQRPDPQPAPCAGGGVAEQDLDAERPGTVGQGGVHRRAEIDDGGRRHPGLGEVEGGVPGAVMGGDDRRAVADLDAVAVEEGLGGAGEHDPGAVVAVEDQRLLQRALGEHDLAGADLPQPLARRALRRGGEVVGDLLAEAEQVLVVVADRRGARHQGDVRQPAELGQGGGQPVPGRLAVDDHGGLGEEGAAGFGILVRQHDGGTGAAGGERGGEAGRAGADDQDVGMGEAGGVAVGVGLGRRGAEAGGVADHRLVDAVPEGARPHEGLVVEAGREQRAEPVVDRADIEGQRRPAVLAGRVEAVAQFLDRGTGVRLEAAGAAAGADQGIGLVGAGRDHAAGAVVLERTAHEVDAVGEQRRGQGVPGEALIGLAVEGEAHRAAGVDAAAARDAVAGHSVPPVRRARSGRGSPAL